MPLLKTNPCTAEDYWNLPDGQHAELIDGRLYNMAPPDRIHQELSFAIARKFADYIDRRGGSCKVYPAPFAVNLNADDETYVEPDISVICDKNKLTDHGCSGAPAILPFSQSIDVGIFEDLSVHIGELLQAL
ncbi:MAG: Uma2 family endonuclease [Blautia sp.]|nr:Uma2 family endonuclease [Blautia sp.]